MQILSTLFECPVTMPLKDDNGAVFDMGNLDVMMCGVSCIDISPDDRLALSGSTDGQVRVIQMDGKYLYRFSQRSSVIAAKFSMDVKYVVSTGYKSIYVWNLQDGSLRFKLKKHNDFVVNIQFDKLGKYMITSSRDKRIVYWDVDTFISLASFYTHCQIDKVSLTSDGEKVIYIPENVGPLAVLCPK